MDALTETGLISCFNYSGKYPGVQFIRKAEVADFGMAGALDIDAVFKALFACPPAAPVDDSLASTMKTLAIVGDDQEDAGKKQLNKAEMANKPVEVEEIKPTKSMQLFRTYQRPIGSRRYALKVLDKFPDGNTWLGKSGQRTASSPGEWPVAYHGTREGNVKDIAEKGLMLANGRRFKFGRGIYCSPDPQTALAYGHEYQFQGRSYKLILQLRVNPAKIRIIPKEETPKDLDEYWVMPDDGDLRAYGICIFEL